MNDSAEQIRKLLNEAGKTISTAESITAGHLQAMLTSVSGASDIFKGGITAYQRAIKVDVLGVNDQLAQNNNCVHQDVAEQMALGALRLFHSDYSIATCGYAETTDEAAPYAFIAMATEKNGCVFSGRVELSGKRIEAQQLCAQLALEKFESMLREETR